MQEIMKSIDLRILNLNFSGEINENFIKATQEFMNGTMQSADPNANGNLLSPVKRKWSTTERTFKTEGLHRLYEELPVEDRDRIIRKVLINRLYVHDLGDIYSIYCIALSLSSLVKDGYESNGVKIVPQDSNEFLHATIESVTALSNYIMGAIALSDFIVHYTKFALADGLTDQQIKRDFKSLLLALNNENRTAGQSPFSNVSLFSREILEDLFGGYGVSLDEVMRVQRLYAEFFTENLPGGLPYRFPISTFNVRAGDEEFLDFIAEKNCLYGNFNIYLSYAKDNKISMCPMSGSSEVIVLNKSGNPIRIKLKDISKGRCKVLCDGEFREGSFNIFKNQEMLKISLSNGQDVVMSRNHINVTLRGDVLAKDLTIGDWIPYSMTAFETHSEGTYKEGYLHGVCAGDGHIREYGIDFCLNHTSKLKVGMKIKEILKSMGISCRERTQGESWIISIDSKEFSSKMQEIVTGKALNKRIKDEVFSKSIEFREGFIQGFQDTDGGNKSRIYTHSLEMVSDLVSLLASIGKLCKIQEPDLRTKEDGKFGDNPTYCVKVYNDRIRKGYKDIYKFHEGKMWFHVDFISPTEKEDAYCFQMNGQRFQLSNGLITHNCRFINELDKMDSFGNGGLDIGSSRVIALNLPHLAILAKGDRERFDELLSEDIHDIVKLHKAHRNILYEAADKGYNKFIRPLGWIKITNLFATVGVTGFHEASMFMNAEPDYTWMQSVSQSIKASLPTDDLIVYNVEEIPGEGACVKLAKSDRLFFGEDVQPFHVYSNQFVPLTMNTGIEERIKVSSELVSSLSGGGISHINTHKLNKEGMKEILRVAIEAGLPHFAVNYGFTECEGGHTYPLGNAKECTCGAAIKEWYSRIIGYYVPVSKWNAERQKEFFRRYWE